MKTSKSFRLSEQAISNLAFIVEKSGSNETAIIELALASFVVAYKPDAGKDALENTAREMGFEDEIYPRTIPSPISKQRKRHKSKN